MRFSSHIAPTLNRYMLVRIFAPMAMILFIILSALSLERLLRLVDIVASENAPVSAALYMLIFLQPHYLGLALPAAVFLSIILAVRQMQESSELVVMQAAGIPYSRLLTPALLVAIGAMLVMLVLTSYAQPNGRYLFRATLQDIQSGGTSLRLQPGIFETIGKNTTIRVDTVGAKGQSFSGFFIEHLDKDGIKTIATARQARFIPPPHSNKPTPGGLSPATHKTRQLDLLLTDARIVKASKNTAAKIITTKSYPLAIETDIPSNFAPRGETKRELTYMELLDGGVPGLAVENTKSELAAEFHARLIQSLSLPFLAILALPLGLMGQGRTGKATGLILGVVLLVLYEKSLGFAESLAATGTVSAFPAIWLPWLVLALCASFSIYKLTRPLR